MIFSSCFMLGFSLPGLGVTCPRCSSYSTWSVSLAPLRQGHVTWEVAAGCSLSPPAHTSVSSCPQSRRVHRLRVFHHLLPQEVCQQRPQGHCCGAGWGPWGESCLGSVSATALRNWSTAGEGQERSRTGSKASESGGDTHRVALGTLGPFGHSPSSQPPAN